jgi:hypothetical protein
MAAWILVLLAYPKETLTLTILDWGISPFFSTSPALLLDLFSWPFAVAITSLQVAVLLSDVARVEEIKPISWSIGFALTGFGLLSVLSGNPLTLAMSWVVLDIVESLTRFQQATTSNQQEQIVVSFSTRLLGIMLLIPAMIIAGGLSINLLFTNIPAQVTGYLILAAGLRLGVLPPQAPFLKETPVRRGLGTLTRLIPVAASMVLLTRVARVGTSPDWSLALIIGAALAVLFGAMTWVWSRDELDGRPYWILSLSALAIVAAVRADPLACQFWGISLIFSGGLIFLYSTRDRRLLWLPILGILGFIPLPFTPTWLGLTIFSGGNVIFWMIFIFGLAALVLGYFRHMMRPGREQDEIEQWATIVYPFGLAVLPITHFWLSWFIGGIALPPGGVQSLHWWVGFFVLGFIGLLFVSFRAGFTWTPETRRNLSNIVSIGWFYKALGGMYRSLSRISNYGLRVLEGDGGVLWAVLILILLLTLIMRRIGGA